MTDEQLAVRAAGGSMACVEELVRRYQIPLLRFAIIRGGDRHRAEDVVQDSFLKMFRSLNRFDPKASFKTWMFTIAQRTIVDASRRRVPVSLPDTFPLIDRSACNDPAVNAARADANEQLWTIARRTLTADQFTVVWLFYVESLNAAEIAVVHGRSWTWVRTALSRARRMLAPQLQAVRSSGIAEGVA